MALVALGSGTVESAAVWLNGVLPPGRGTAMAAEAVVLQFGSGTMVKAAAGMDRTEAPDPAVTLHPDHGIVRTGG